MKGMEFKSTTTFGNLKQGDIFIGVGGWCLDLFIKTGPENATCIYDMYEDFSDGHSYVFKPEESVVSVDVEFIIKIGGNDND